MSFSIDTVTGLRFARDRRDGAFVAQDPAQDKDGEKWVRHLGKGRTISVVAVRSHLEPLTAAEVAEAKAAYFAWLARVPTERAEVEADARRNVAEREAVELARIEQSRKAQEQAEAAALGRSQLRALLLEFEVTGFDNAHVLPLMSLLLRTKEGECLSDEDHEWLKNNRLYTVAALAYENAFRKTLDVWYLVRACASYRDAEMPRRALQTSNEGLTQLADARAISALLTTRGGAFRDLGDLPHALQSAHEAIQQAPSAHAYNLLGGIFFDMHNMQEADMSFSKAAALSRLNHDKDAEWKRVMQKGADQTRSAAASYLFAKDPVRYAWVSQFL